MVARRVEAAIWGNGMAVNDEIQSKSPSRHVRMRQLGVLLVGDREPGLDRGVLKGPGSIARGFVILRWTRTVGELGILEAES